MTPRRALTSTSVLLALALPAALVAGCGGGSGSSGSPASTGASGSSGTTTAAPTESGTAAVVDVRSTSVGHVLVDSKGRTLYLFEKDHGGKSACSGDCAKNWPPYTSEGKPSAGSGVSAGKLGTTSRSDGTSQVTYGGHPLYRYAADTKAGDTNGQGVDAFGAEWYVVGTNGSKIEHEEESGSGGTTSTPSSGYGY